jgi:glycosyltransferase involved in cell wall biosynthesis
MLIGGCQEDYASANPDFVSKQWLQAVHQEGVVEWLGLRSPEEVEHWMQRAAAVVLPSYYPEGVPRSLIEAAALARPIITTDTPGCRDIALDGVSGLLCPPHSPDRLAHAIVQIMHDPVLADQMGQNGRVFVIEKFEQNMILSKLFDIYYSR